MTTLTSSDMIALFPNEVLVMPPDSLYACVDEEWLLGEFSQWFTQFLADQGLTYGLNFDCNRFATLYITMLAIAFRKLNPDSKDDTAPAACMVFYWRDDGIRHAICRVCTGAGRSLWIEPQPVNGKAGQPCKVSDKEFGSMFFALCA